MNGERFEITRLGLGLVRLLYLCVCTGYKYSFPPLFDQVLFVYFLDDVSCLFHIEPVIAQLI